MNRKEMLARLKAGEDSLELTIQKWQDIVNGEGRNLGTQNCALCEGRVGCEGCPVCSESGEGGCNGTPYETYCLSKNAKERKKSAVEELEFLKSLRKEATS